MTSHDMLRVQKVLGHRPTFLGKILNGQRADRVKKKSDNTFVVSDSVEAVFTLVLGKKQFSHFSSCEKAPCPISLKQDMSIERPRTQ